jgi:hypothetical protein
MMMMITYKECQKIRSASKKDKTDCGCQSILAPVNGDLLAREPSLPVHKNCEYIRPIAAVGERVQKWKTEDRAT